MNNLKKFKILLSSIKKRGLINTFSYIAYDYLFDHIWGTETFKYEALNNLQIDSKNKISGEDYQACNYFLLRKIFKLFKNDIKNSIFVDFGSGKGRTLIMACHYGAEQVIGVEFSSRLVSVSKNNLNRYLLKSGKKLITHIVNSDASIYIMPSDASIAFFYNPFNKEVMAKVLLNNLNHNTIYIYVNPVHKEVFIENNFTEIYNYANEFIVYRYYAYDNKK